MKLKHIPVPIVCCSGKYGCCSGKYCQNHTERLTVVTYDKQSEIIFFVSCKATYIIKSSKRYLFQNATDYFPIFTITAKTIRSELSDIEVVKP